MSQAACTCKPRKAACLAGVLDTGRAALGLLGNSLLHQLTSSVWIAMTVLMWHPMMPSSALLFLLLKEHTPWGLQAPECGARSWLTVSPGAGSIFMEGAAPSGLREKLSNVLEGLPVTVLVSLATFLGIFMDDCRLAFLPPANDVSCEVISFGILVSLA